MRGPEERKEKTEQTKLVKTMPQIKAALSQWQPRE